MHDCPTPAAPRRRVSGATPLQAHCDDLTIRIAHHWRNEPLERSHEHHEITVPAMHATAVLNYRSTCGQPQQTMLSDRHVCIIPAGHAHSASWAPGSGHTCIAVQPGLLRAMAQQCGHGAAKIEPQIAPHYASVDPFLWHLARALAQQLQQRRALEKSYLESLAVVIAQHLLNTYGTTPAPATAAAAALGGLPRHKLRRAIDYIRAHHRDDIGFQDVAAQLHMSPYHFARLFKLSTRETPHQFITRCRIESASERLLHSDDSIADIAFQVGYKSPSYFSTRFAAQVGMTPATFRNGR